MRYLFVASFSLVLLFTLKKKHLFFIGVALSSMFGFFASVSNLKYNTNFSHFKIFSTIFYDILLLLAFFAMLYYEKKGTKGSVYVLSICNTFLLLMMLIFLTTGYCTEKLGYEKIVSYLLVPGYILEHSIVGLTLAVLVITKQKHRKETQGTVLCVEENCEKRKEE